MTNHSDFTNNSKGLNNFDEFSRLYNKKLNDMKGKIYSQQQENEFEENDKVTEEAKSVESPSKENDLALLNNGMRSKKRSEQMRKRLDKVSGEKFYFKYENEESRIEERKDQTTESFRMVTYTNKNPQENCFETYNKNVNAQDNNYQQPNSINQVHPSTNQQSSNNISSQGNTDDPDELNISNLDGSFVKIESDQPMTESQKIIANHHMLHGTNQSFIPITNNLNLMKNNKQFNLTDSYQMALGAGNENQSNVQTTSDNKSLMQEVIEEEESFQESEMPTPNNKRLASGGTLFFSNFKVPTGTFHSSSKSGGSFGNINRLKAHSIKTVSYQGSINNNFVTQNSLNTLSNSISNNNQNLPNNQNKTVVNSTIIPNINHKLSNNNLNNNTINININIPIWGLGIGDWGLGIGDWAQSPIPNPQSPIPNI